MKNNNSFSANSHDVEVEELESMENSFKSDLTESAVVTYEATNKVEELSGEGDETEYPIDEVRIYKESKCNNLEMKTAKTQTKKEDASNFAEEEDGSAVVVNIAAKVMADVGYKEPAKSINPYDPTTESNRSTYSSSDEESSLSSTESDTDEMTESHEYSSSTGAFNMRLLQKCIEDAGPVLDEVQGKDVVLVVGKTGVGKSLFLQGIAGKKIVAATHQTTCAGRTVTSDVFEAVDPLPGFEVGHDKVSKTRSINSFVSGGGGSSRGEVVYIDSPGWEDTAGCEVDIASAVMTNKVMKIARSLKIVVLINYASLLEDRGGAMRDVLKVAHTFVSDFEQDKRSFMFLFTHINEVGVDSPTLLDSARSRIQDKLQQIWKGTSKDDAVKPLLGFIWKSLLKKKQSVDVVHPVATNFRHISRCIENKLRPIQHPTPTGDCGLSGKAGMKFERQIGRLVSSCRQLIHRSKSGQNIETVIGELQEIRTILKYFDSEIGSQNVQAAYNECEGLCQQYVEKLRLEIDTEVKKATDERVNFGRGNVDVINASLARMRALSQPNQHDISISEYYLQGTLSQAFQVSYERATQDTSLENIELTLKELGKLKSWCEGFECFRDAYEEACRQLTAKIDSLVSDIKMVIDNDEGLGELCEREISSYVQKLAPLCTLDTASKHFVHLNIETESCSIVISEFKRQLHIITDEWAASAAKTDSTNDNKQADDGTIPSVLFLIADRATKLETWHRNFHEDTSTYFRDEVKKIECSLERLERLAFTSFQKLCDSARAEMKNQPDELKAKFQSLYEIYSIFKELPKTNRWQEMLEAYRDIQSHLKLEIEILSRDIDCATYFTIESGLRDGQKDAKGLGDLGSLRWFDEYNDESDKSFQTYFENARDMYYARMDKIVAEMTRISVEMEFLSPKNKTRLQECHYVFVELDQFKAFEETLHGDSGVAVGKQKEVRETLRKYLNTFSTNATRLSSDWLMAFEKGQTERAQPLTEKLISALAEIELIDSFHSFDCFKEEVRATKDQIVSKFELVKETIDKDFCICGDYETKAAHLDFMGEISEFSSASQFLPDYKMYKEKARDMVSDAAQEVEGLISQKSTDGELINRSMKAFEDAKVLDAYTSNEATKRLQQIKSLRERKGKEQDKLLEDMIANNDFVGIGKFLKPLQNSSDLVTKEKFKQHSRNIGKLMMARARTAQPKLTIHPSQADLEFVVETLEILTNVIKEVGPQISMNGINLPTDRKRLLNTLNERLNSLTEAALNGIAFRDFFKMEKNLLYANVVFNTAEQFLDPKVKGKFKHMQVACNDAIASVPGLVTRFVESSFCDGCQELEEILGSLKIASSCHDPELPYMQELYTDTTSQLSKQVQTHLHNISDRVEETGSYENGIEILERWRKSENSGLKEHLSSIPFDGNVMMEKWTDERNKIYNLDRSGQCPDQLVRDYKKKMDKLKKTWTLTKLLWDTDRTYLLLQKQVKAMFVRECNKCRKSLDESNLSIVQQSLNVLDLMVESLAVHVPELAGKTEEMRQIIVGKFVRGCQRASRMLRGGNRKSFEGIFPVLRNLAVNFPTILDQPEAAQEFGAVNELAYKALESCITGLQDAVSQGDFLGIVKLVKLNRTHGAFLADNYLLFMEELKLQGKPHNDKWLSKIQDRSIESFSCGRDLKNLKSFAILGIVPSASIDEIRKAYKQKARHVHPDKKRGNGSAAISDDAGKEFRRVKLAHDCLLDAFDSRGPEQLCDAILLDMPSRLTKHVREWMESRRYDSLKRLLECLPDFESVCNLVLGSKMDYETVRNSIIQLVSRHVHGVRVQVDTRWKERQYKELNESITDLRCMENNLKIFPEIFDRSWNQGTIESVEEEIKALGATAKGMLRDKKTAMQHSDDFRRSFVRMGTIFVELQMFKDFTKDVMYGVLERCLDSDWGYNYLFKLGQSFHNDKSGGHDEVRIGLTFMSEFSHFKEVNTMAWNEETIQKPAEDTVKEIKGKQMGVDGELVSPMDIDKDMLLESFHSFDVVYKSLLDEFLSTKSDKVKLARKTVTLAKNLRPLSGSSGWDGNVKAAIPKVLAGVFALLTIEKSGDSYIRMSDTSGAQPIGDKILMKPHNIQVFSVLLQLGCGNASTTSLQSQLTQIRTGEGKSMVLGATAAVLGLFGFKVRCVCYSDYLSNRDHSLFEPVFRLLGLGGSIVYSKITQFSEQVTRRKGDIRHLTQSLLNQQLTDRSGMFPQDVATATEEILLVDEVDVFFGKEFYGQTYNQVAEIRRPEIAQILTGIWNFYQQSGRRPRFSHVQKYAAYQSLVGDMPRFRYLIDNEILLMLDHVGRVDEKTYFLDRENDMIGYKVLDTISYQVTHGYRTIFAYLKEASNGNLRNKTQTLGRVLVMPISCGQFSYASLPNTRILGVSGTLESMGPHEKNVLLQYGVGNYVTVPSVYGDSNFVFDKAGDGISIERDQSDYFHRICKEIVDQARAKRAVIVFFKDTEALHKFKASPLFPKIGRGKAVLCEDMDPSEKEFVINKAATAGQVTLCPAVFGRGTDFFCHDEVVQQAGGVHIIQTFLSTEFSEEVQIRGRTSRQGKKGSYQLVLLESDLRNDFGATVGEKDKVSRNQRYEWLCTLRKKKQDQRWQEIHESLAEASVRDVSTHAYFDSLLDGNEPRATQLFEDLYRLVKNRNSPEAITIDLAFLVDITGSMASYCDHTISTIQGLVKGDNSISALLKHTYPHTELKIRIGVMGYRDIEDGSCQFKECRWNEGSHFTDSMSGAVSYLRKICSQPSGGKDLAEDHLGAISRCIQWNQPSDWSSSIKMIVLFTDAPAHGCVPRTSLGVPNVDEYLNGHPNGVTASKVAAALSSRGMNLFMCSYNPSATAATEKLLSDAYLNHPQNPQQREVVRIPMVPQTRPGAVGDKSALPWMGNDPRHIVFVLDESISMTDSWAGVVESFHEYIAHRRQSQNDSDLVSVIQFGAEARVTINLEWISQASKTLVRQGRGTRFAPGAIHAFHLVSATPPSHTPTVVFMSDGAANDSAEAASIFARIDNKVKSTHGHHLDLHVVAFRNGTDTRQLQAVAASSPLGKVHLSSDTASLTKVFVAIAGGESVGTALNDGITREISEAITETLSLEYLS